MLKTDKQLNSRLEIEQRIESLENQREKLNNSDCRKRKGGIYSINDVQVRNAKFAKIYERINALKARLRNLAA